MSVVRILLLSLSLIALVAPVGADTTLPVIRAAVLPFGTVSWELETVRAEGLDQTAGFQLQLLPLASMTAIRTALKSDEAELIVADWLWVSRQRAAGERLLFMPFSTAVGKLIAAPDSGIGSLEDLAGKRLGIAGGPLSKGWLLLQAVALQRHLDLSGVELQFGAPPLLNAALERGQLDAVITFWHYAARLEEAGYPALVDLTTLTRELGLQSELPMLGYVFKQRWAESHPDQVRALRDATQAARRQLIDTEASWERLRPQMKADSESLYQRLRAAFLAGTPQPLDDVQVADAARLFRLLAEIGGEPLVGGATELDSALFWRP